MAQYLLMLGCSENKMDSPELLPALARYDGVNYRVIKKLEREGRLSKEVKIVIISAEYGFLPSDRRIHYYDRRMTLNRAKELNAEILECLTKLLKDSHFGEIFVNLGKDYLPAVEGFENFITERTRLTYARGRIGEKMSQMKRWLLRITTAHEHV